MPFNYLMLDLPKYIVNGPIQAKGFETRHRYAALFSDPHSGAGRAVHQDGFYRAAAWVRLQSDVVADRAERRVPAARDHQRALQVLHQHLQGPARRAHAAAAALRSDRSRAALSADRVPPGQAGRDRHHDQGRGGAARRVHRRCLRAALLSWRADRDGTGLHPAAELHAGSDRGRAAGGAGRS